MKKDKKKKLRKKFKVRPASAVQAAEFPVSSPLSEAVCSGDSGRVLSLLEQQADPNQRVGNSSCSDSLLDLAVTRSGSPEILRLLLERGADPNRAFHLEVYPNGMAYRRSPLQEAAAAGSGELVRLLLEHGADSNLPELGFAPTGEPVRTSMLSCAVLRRHAEILRLLLEHGADPNRATRTVSCGGHLSRVPVLSDAAVTVQDGELVRLLLEHGADPDCALVGFCEDGRPMEESLLNIAVRKGCKTEILRQLLERGADPNRAYRLWAGRRGNVFYTPLYDAMKQDRGSEAVQLLRQFGAFLMTAKDDEA